MRAMNGRRWLGGLLAALWLGATPVALAGADADAKVWVQERQTELLGALKGQKASDARVTVIVDTMLDYDVLARESLGQAEWDARNPDERAQFQGLLTALVRKSYRKNLDKTLLDYDVAYAGVEQTKAGVVVRTSAKSRKDKREEPTQIDYLLHQVDGQWRIRDITTEGSSMVRNYRRQFNKIIKRDGFPELLKRMQKKLDSKDDGDDV